MKHNFDELIELARAHHSENSDVSWDELRVDEDTAFRMIGSSVVEMVSAIDSTTDREMILISSLISSTVDNFLINLDRIAPDQNFKKTS